MKFDCKLTKTQATIIGATSTGLFCAFITGYILGNITNGISLKNMCAQNLNIDINDIRKVSTNEDTVSIDLESVGQLYTSEDGSIYDIIEERLILDLKEGTNKDKVEIY